MLQWSRNFIVAEMSTCRHTTIWGPQLQWSRNFIVAEIVDVHVPLNEIYGLMEPQLYRCGNLVFSGKSHPTILASMEPQLYRCGNLAGGHAMRIQWDRFNGAATLSLRKSEGDDEGSEEAPKLQWSRNFIVAEIRTRLPTARSGRTASMEPQLYRCGNMQDVNLRQRKTISFNGAVTLSLRKSEGDDEGSEEAPKLQWSRNFIVAEIRTRLPTARSGRTASMEPQLYRCGNMQDVNLRQRKTISFNGAATLSLRKSLSVA